MKRIIILFLAVIIFACNSKKETITGLVTDSAMVVSAHGLASQVGVEIMLSQRSLHWQWYFLRRVILVAEVLWWCG
jgi:hypothetical protein